MMLRIRNMESDRCMAMVKDKLSKHGLQYKNVELGEAKLKGNISDEKPGGASSFFE